MAKLLGTSPSQVPTNADLGDLAYQDGDNAIIGPITVVDGDVGIGTSAPADRLHIFGGGVSHFDASPVVSLVDTVNALDAGPKLAFFGANRKDVGEEMASIEALLFGNNGGSGNVQSGSLAFSTFGSERLRITRDGNVGIATSGPTQKLDVNDDSIRVRTAKTPSSASDTGTTGQIAWDADYIYVCTATDTWKRVAIATW
jgi:hypothetical protein